LTLSFIFLFDSNKACLARSRGFKDDDDVEEEEEEVVGVVAEVDVDDSAIEAEFKSLT